jgi:zinc transport system substrate-binding protein
MRKTIILLAGVFFFGAWMAAPFSLQAREPGRPLQVVCTILPVYILTLNVVGQIPGIDVKLLLPPHQGCPHNYDLTPSDLIKIARADLIVANGLGLEEFLEKTLKQANLKIRVLLAAEKVEPIRLYIQKNTRPTRITTITGLSMDTSGSVRKQPH